MNIKIKNVIQRYRISLFTETKHKNKKRVLFNWLIMSI